MGNPIIDIPEGVEAEIVGNHIEVKSGEVQASRIFPKRSLDISKKNNQILLTAKFENARTRALLGTFRAHINNMIKGVKEPFVYKLKVCSIHFPMSVKVTPTHVEISNFLGGKRTRSVKLASGVNVQVEGDIITISSHDIELAGMIATKIEQTTRIRNRDRRVFQDGIFLISKAGRSIG